MKALRVVAFGLLLGCLYYKAVNAAIVEFNPWCSQGPGFDADKNGVIDDQERGGCDFADQFVSSPNGWSVEVTTCILEGFIKSREVALPGGFSVVQDPTRDFYTSQIWCKGTIPSGEYEVWALLKFPNAANAGLNIGPKLYSSTEGGVDIGSEPPVLFTTPSPEFQWFHLKNVNYMGGEKGLFIKSDSGQNFGCLLVRIPTGKLPVAGELECPDNNNSPVSVVVIPAKNKVVWVWAFKDNTKCQTVVSVTKGKKLASYSSQVPLNPQECK